MSLPNGEKSVVLTVRVVPNAKRDAVDGWFVEGEVVKVRIAAPARDDRANEALVRFLAKQAGVPRGDVRIVGGARSRTKRIAVDGAPGWGELCRRLGVGSGESARRGEPDDAAPR